VSAGDIKSRAEAAFAMEYASSAALKSIAEATPNKEFVEMAWMLGYVKGLADAYQQALDMTAEPK
jgi:hypothetical protein